MASFYIQKIIASGEGKKDAVITFTKGLNIIHGPSDTGKSCILKCINFMFDKSTIPFDTKITGYSKVEMIVATENGSVKLQRSLGRNQIFVTSEDKNIVSGKYNVEYNSNSKTPCINSLWLKLIGINEDIMLVYNKSFEKRRMTWKTFMKLIYLNEDNVCSSKSFLELMESTSKTLFLSSLLYLFTGHSFSNIDAQENEKIRASNKKAIENFINKQLGHMEKRKRELTEQLSTFENINIEKDIEELVADLKSTEKEIINATEQSKDLLSILFDLREKYAKCELSISQFQSLKSQYIADIKRLTFIVDGESNLLTMLENTQCPFCEGEIKPNNKISYKESARGELARITYQLKDLINCEEDILEEKHNIQSQIEIFENEKSNIELLITENLKPRAKKLTKSIKIYGEFLKLSNEIDFIQDFAQTTTQDLRQLTTQNNSQLNYRPKEYFSDDFITTIDNYAYEILEKCKYENLVSAHFNLSNFDLEINGSKKSASHGKGIKAFVNTVLTLTFRKYFANNSKYNPGLLMIDSPLLGLDQGVDDLAPESMRTALFKYFMDNQSEGQVIVVENKNTMPKLDYKSSGANVIEFTKGKCPGRCGFLYLDNK
ncbi:AAA family ATPase [Terrisporobacter mayombei]|uniref:AAA family ATPase n=1 Tax=Terrisporobacter mayombei TaxID=1541 RepID=UPI00265808CE|nr:AAA family ATPase [Terrisporobacter mayombei]MCC3669089.1 AAA family ATPase [Terrisporobacter mayombei]